jgi:hypothetical protein
MSSYFVLICLDSTRSDEDHHYLGGDIVIARDVVAQDFFSFLVLYNYIIPIRNVVLQYLVPVSSSSIHEKKK